MTSSSPTAHESSAPVAKPVGPMPGPGAGTREGERSAWRCSDASGYPGPPITAQPLGPSARQAGRDRPEDPANPDAGMKSCQNHVRTASLCAATRGGGQAALGRALGYNGRPSRVTWALELSMRSDGRSDGCATAPTRGGPVNRGVPGGVPGTA